MVNRCALKTAELIRMLRKQVEKLAGMSSGRIVGSGGDGYLVEFARVSDATLFALNLQYFLKRRNESQDRAERLTLRAGMDCGDIIDDEGELHGECINLAVRLQEAAPSGGILVSERIHAEREQDAEIEFERLGKLHLKNIASSMEVYLLQREGEPLSLSATDELQPEVLEDLPGVQTDCPIAVMPFQNPDKDPDMEHICEGLKDELVLYLSRSRLLPVVESHAVGLRANSTSEALANARQLDVRYLLLGTVSQQARDYSIAAKLIDTKDGHIIWSDKYNANSDQMHNTVDDIVLRIAGTIGSHIARREESRARSKRASRATVTDLIWRGRWHMNRLTRNDSVEAEKYFNRVLAIEPGNAEALIQLCYLRWIGTWAGRESGESIQATADLAYQAMSASDNDPRCHFLVGAASILLHDIEGAIVHLEKAIELNPSLAQAFAQLGSCHMLAGRPREAIPLLELSLRLNPQDYYVFYVLGELAACHCMVGDWEAAIAYARKSMSYRPFYWHARMSEINASARQGNMSSAKRSLNALYARRPDFSREYIEWLPFTDRSWVDYFAEGIEMTRDWQSLSA